MNRMRFSERVIELTRRIPRGRVATYGQLSLLAGNPGAARQVARILHSCSEKEGLPWHRVINSKGSISLKDAGYRIQKQLLEKEGVRFDEDDRVDLDRFLWRGGIP